MTEVQKSSVVEIYLQIFVTIFCQAEQKILMKPEGNFAQSTLYMHNQLRVAPGLMVIVLGGRPVTQLQIGPSFAFRFRSRTQLTHHMQRRKFVLSVHWCHCWGHMGCRLGSLTQV